MCANSSLSTPVDNLDVVFSFDTTSSMCNWLTQLRGRIQDMIQRLQADIPGIKMAGFAHGDYCDTDIYVTKWTDLTNNMAELCNFVKNSEQTGGGDAPECYELVLRQVRTELSWTPGSRRVLVLIGDDNPHEPGDIANKDNIDWRVEVKALAQEAVTIYGVQCGHNAYADKFYKSISLATGGKHLRLEDFGSLFDTLMAVCYREGHDTAMLANYEKEVRARCVGGALAADIDAIFASLRHDDVDSPASLPVDPLTTLPPPVDPLPTLPPAVNPVTTLPPAVDPLTTLPPPEDPLSTLLLQVKPMPILARPLNPLSTLSRSLNPMPTLPWPVNLMATHQPQFNAMPTLSRPVNPMPTPAWPVNSMPTLAWPVNPMPTPSWPVNPMPTPAWPVNPMPTPAWPVNPMPTLSRPVNPMPTLSRPVNPMPTPAWPVNSMPTLAWPVNPMSTPSWPVNPMPTPAWSANPMSTPAWPVNPMPTPAWPVNPMSTLARPVNPMPTPTWSANPMPTLPLPVKAVTILPLTGAAATNRRRKTPSNVKARLNKYKVSNLPLLKRENVPEYNFNLRSLSWSPWKLAIVSSEDLPEDNTDKWGKRVGRPGYRLKMLSSSTSSSMKDNHRPVLFEVAVQGSGRYKKRHVVFSAFSSLSLDTNNWERRLLGVTRSQVDYVLKAGGRVYVRFWLVNNHSLSESPRKYIRRYDYAWKKVRKVRSHPRDVVKGNIIISKSAL